MTITPAEPATGSLHALHPILPIDPAAAGRPQFVRPALSAREREVLLAWLRSDSKSRVAQELVLSLGTVNTHLTRIRAKYAEVNRPASSKAALVARALQDGLVTVDEL